MILCIQYFNSTIHHLSLMLAHEIYLTAWQQTNKIHQNKNITTCHLIIECNKYSKVYWNVENGIISKYNKNKFLCGNTLCIILCIFVQGKGILCTKLLVKAATYSWALHSRGFRHRQDSWTIAKDIPLAWVEASAPICPTKALGSQCKVQGTGWSICSWWRLYCLTWRPSSRRGRLCCKQNYHKRNQFRFIAYYVFVLSILLSFRYF